MEKDHMKAVELQVVLEDCAQGMGLSVVAREKEEDDWDCGDV